jgi:hypothetical protein
VDVVVRMIGYIFLKMWAFCGESGPPPLPSFFSSLVLLLPLLLVLPFVGFLEKEDTLTQEDTGKKTLCRKTRSRRRRRRRRRRR